MNSYNIYFKEKVLVWRRREVISPHYTVADTIPSTLCVNCLVEGYFFKNPFLLEFFYITRPFFYLVNQCVREEMAEKKSWKIN